jgi:LytS/YehU family sensor histidine kinase
MIIPFILITIVENAFKHGDLKNSESPINILLFVDDQNGIYFYCHNKKKTGPKELSTGIGLDNTKKRLDMIYGDQYTLNIKDEMDSYIVELNIRTL